MPSKKIAFATSSFDEKTGKPASPPWDKVNYPEFNAMRSSKFNGLSVPDFRKLAFQEGSDKVKIGYRGDFVELLPPEPDGTSKFIPVKILAGETMPLNVPRSNNVPNGCTVNDSPITGELIGNNDFFPVGPGTPWIEVDIEFLSLLFWRVKKWKASASGSMDAATLDGGYISTNTPGTDQNINEEILISNADPVLASIVTPPGGDPWPPANMRRKDEVFGSEMYREGVGGRAGAEFILSREQRKNLIIRGGPAHFGACLKMFEKNIIPENDRYVLSVPGTGNAPTKYFINPTALYGLTCYYQKYEFRWMGFDGCGGPGQIRGASISYGSSGQNFIKNSQSSSSTICVDTGFPDCESENNITRTTSSASLGWSKTLNDGYTLNIKVGDVTKTFTMPLFASASTFTNSWSRENNCGPHNAPQPQFYTSIESFPRPSFVVNLEADEFWEYDNGKGSPIYNKSTGARLRNPVTGK